MNKSFLVPFSWSMSHQKLACTLCKVRPAFYIGQSRQDGQVKFCGAHCLKLYQIGDDRDVRGDINPIVDGLVNSVSPQGTVPYPEKDAGTIGDVHDRLAFLLLGKDTITGSYNDFARDMRDGVMDKAREMGYDLTIPTIEVRDELMEQRVNAKAAADQVKNLYLEWEDAKSQGAYVREVAGPLYEGLRVVRGDDETGTFLFLLFDPLTAKNVQKAREMKQDGSNPDCDDGAEGELDDLFDEVREAFFEAARQDDQIGIGLPSILKKAITPGRPYSPDTIADLLARLYLAPYCTARNMSDDEREKYIASQVESSMQATKSLIFQEKILRTSKENQAEWNSLVQVLVTRLTEKAASGPSKTLLSRFRSKPPKTEDAQLRKYCNPAPKAADTTALAKQLIMLYKAYYPADEGTSAKKEQNLVKRREAVGKDVASIANSIARKMGPEHVSYLSGWVNFALYIGTEM